MINNFRVNEWYKGETNQLFTLALKSSIICGSMGALTIFYCFFVGWAAASLRLPGKIFLGISTLLPMAATIIKIDDTVDDWGVWYTQNSAEKRIQVIDQVTEGSIASIRNYSFGDRESVDEWAYKKWYSKYLDTLDFSAPPVQEDSPLIWDPSETLSADPYSSIIAGVPSAGKGIVVSNSIRKLVQRYPEIKVTVLDPKGDPKEQGYWDIEGVEVHRFRCMQESPESLKEWLLDEVESFRFSLSSPRLLVVDELAMILSTLGTLPSKSSGIPELKRAITQITSTGDSQGAWVWLLTQVVNAADLGFSAGFRDMMRPLALISPRNSNAAKALLRTSFVSNPGFERIQELCKLSPVGRAGYNGSDGNWYPIQKLPNYSTQDRDARFG